MYALYACMFKKNHKYTLGTWHNYSTILYLQSTSSMGQAQILTSFVGKSCFCKNDTLCFYLYVALKYNLGADTKHICTPVGKCTLHQILDHWCCFFLNGDHIFSSIQFLHECHITQRQVTYPHDFHDMHNIPVQPTGYSGSL